jgi:hypothetical protein
MIKSIAYEEKLSDNVFFKNDYSYYLVLTTPLKLPLFKDRNFNLEVGLFDDDHKPVPNSISKSNLGNSIPLHITLNSCSDKHELIDSNKQGNPIFKGTTSVNLISGYAIFNKLAIREVSTCYT